MQSTRLQLQMYKTIIGLEVHIEQTTQSKVFCGCPANHFAQKPNTQTCPTCLGLPGGMPYLNKQAVYNTLKFGLALNCQPSSFSKFDRKHYYYPDLPKGFQISQYDLPLCTGGVFVTSSGVKVGITRIHLEEDTGKLVHTEVSGKRVSLIDFNRSGVPLMELVTEPDFSTISEAVSFAKEIQRIVRYLGIADADMEKGSMRLEANISVAPSTLGGLPDYKVELKNINSFRFMEKALEAEVVRQTELLEKGEKPQQETRGYNEATGNTFLQRSKEDAQDYRYFPEPDLPPLTFTSELISQLRSEIPELPSVKKARYIKEFQLPENFADFLVSSVKNYTYFEEAVDLASKHEVSVKAVADLIVNRNAMEDFELPASLISKLVMMVKKAYASDEEIKEAVEKVIHEQVKAVTDFKSGKEQVFGFLVGMVQKELNGTGETALVRKILSDKLKI